MSSARGWSRRFWRLAFPACLALSGCSALLLDVGGGLTPELAQRGVSATARILEIWDTGWTINDNPVIGMRVEVDSPDRPPFEARIEKTTVSRIAIPQFQPGAVVPVRFDPASPSLVAVDPEGPASPPAAGSGNPYRDRFQAAEYVGAALLPPPAAPRIYLGTGDSGADRLALSEHEYVLLGAASATRTPDLALVLEQGRALGAALIVVYGHFTPLGSAGLEVVPFRPRATGSDAEALAEAEAARTQAIFSTLGPDDQVAVYWAQSRPAILGIVSRPLAAAEQARLGRRDGIVVESVAHGSPAEAGGLVAGDVLVAIDGAPLADARQVPGQIAALAGRTVRIDLLRDGRPLALAVQLHPAAP